MRFNHIPTHKLIEEANRIEKSFVDWSGTEITIDKELESRQPEDVPIIYDENGQEIEELIP
jgi:hypothetical protein